MARVWCIKPKQKTIVQLLMTELLTFVRQCLSKEYTRSGSAEVREPEILKNNINFVTKFQR